MAAAMNNVDTYRRNLAEGLLSKFKTEMEQLGQSDNTVRAYLSDVEHFFYWHGGSQILNSSSLAVRCAEYMNQIKHTYSAATVRRRRAALRLFAKLVFGADVLENYRTPTPATGDAHPLPRATDDLRQMLGAAHDRHRPLIALCGYAGARVSEARQVRVRDVTQDDKGQWWVRFNGKGSKVRDVPLVEEAVALLGLKTEDDPDRRLAPFSDRAARRAITNAAVRAGISRPVSSHDLRMTFGTEVYRTSTDLRATQDLLGHASPDTTVRYTMIRTNTKINATQGAFS